MVLSDSAGVGVMAFCLNVQGGFGYRPVEVGTFVVWPESSGLLACDIGVHSRVRGLGTFILGSDVSEPDWLILCGFFSLVLKWV